MDLATQALTIVGVLLGALTSYVIGFLVERSKDQRSLIARWDERKLETYVTYVARVRDVIYTSVLVYESREGLRAIEFRLLFWLRFSLSCGSGVLGVGCWVVWV